MVVKGHYYQYIRVKPNIVVTILSKLQLIKLNNYHLSEEAPTIVSVMCLGWGPRKGLPLLPHIYHTPEPLLRPSSTPQNAPQIYGSGFEFVSRDGVGEPQ